MERKQGRGKWQSESASEGERFIVLTALNLASRVNISSGSRVAASRAAMKSNEIRSPSTNPEKACLTSLFSGWKIFLNAFMLKKP